MGFITHSIYCKFQIRFIIHFQTPATFLIEFLFQPDMNGVSADECSLVPIYKD